MGIQREESFKKNNLKLSEIKKRKTILKNQISSLPDKFDIKKIIIAYEPVWAIGTGKIPYLNEIDEIHKSIRKLLEKKNRRLKK